MTGRDLIIYILENKLEDEEIINSMSIDETALRFGVTPETVKVWFDLKMISGIKVIDKIFILYDIFNKGGK